VCEGSGNFAYVQLQTRINTSRGLCNLTFIRAVDDPNQIIADLAIPNPPGIGTIFSALVILDREREVYKILRLNKKFYTEDFWLELEALISNEIITNE
jgi:hypothetical protein